MHAAIMSLTIDKIYMVRWVSFLVVVSSAVLVFALLLVTVDLI